MHTHRHTEREAHMDIHSHVHNTVMLRHTQIDPTVYAQTHTDVGRHEQEHIHTNTH